MSKKMSWSSRRNLKKLGDEYAEVDQEAEVEEVAEEKGGEDITKFSLVNL